MASRWFSIFMLGGKLKIGLVRNQDKVLTVDQLLLGGNISEKECVQSNYEEEKKELESKIEFSTISFFVYL